MSSGGQDHHERCRLLREVRRPQPVRDQGRADPPGPGRQVGPDLPQRRPRQPELDRDPGARGVLPARPVRADRVEAGDERRGGRPRRHAAARRLLQAAEGLGREAQGRSGHARRRDARGGRRLRDHQVRLRPGQVRQRADRLDHRRPLPGARPGAGPQRGDHPRVPDVGDVRRPPADREVRPLPGRGRHRGDVLRLQGAEERAPAQRRRHHRHRHADLHALPRDAAPRGLCAEADPRLPPRPRTASSSPTTT